MKAVEAAVSGLAFGDREVLWLIGHDSLSVEAAARVLGVSAATFRVRLHRPGGLCAAASRARTSPPRRWHPDPRRNRPI